MNRLRVRFGRAGLEPCRKARPDTGVVAHEKIAATPSAAQAALSAWTFVARLKPCPSVFTGAIVSVALFILLTGTTSLLAQTNPCALARPRPEIGYPPIAKAAHIEGTVVAVISFAHDGSVNSSRIISGPPLLLLTAKLFFENLKAMPSDGTRDCPFAVDFRIANESQSCAQIIAAMTPVFVRVCSESIVLTTVKY